MQIRLRWDGLLLTCPFCGYGGVDQKVDSFDLYTDTGIEYRYTVKQCVECGEKFSIQVDHKNVEEKHATNRKIISS